MRPIPQVLLMVETSKAYGRGLLEGIGRYALAHGPWSAYLEERSLADRLPPWIGQWKGDGIIVRAHSRAMLGKLTSLGVPVVETDPKFGGGGLPWVYTDDSKVAQLAVDHFFERGLRQIAWCDISRTRWAKLRRDPFVAELSRRGCSCDEYELPAHLLNEPWQRQREHLVGWLKKLPHPSGILAANDVCGYRVLDACRLIGISVPEQIAVLGVDNDPVLCRLASPPLSSVDLDVERIGYEAAALLSRLMKGKRAPAHPVLIAPKGVVQRQSTDVLAMSDREVADAVRFIRLRACEGIDVRDVLAEVPISRRALERRFRQCLGRSPKEEISRVRLARVKELLAHTDSSIAQIAREGGFKSVHYLSSYFKRETGISPSAFRGQAR